MGEEVTPTREFVLSLEELQSLLWIAYDSAVNNNQPNPYNELDFVHEALERVFE